MYDYLDCLKWRKGVYVYEGPDMGTNTRRCAPRSQCHLTISQGMSISIDMICFRADNVGSALNLPLLVEKSSHRTVEVCFNLCSLLRTFGDACAAVREHVRRRDP